MWPGGRKVCSSVDVYKRQARERRTADHAGVGDAFVAGFLYGVTQGMDYIRCARLGSVTASFVLEQKGCLNGAPTLEQVLARERENY